MMGDDVIVLDDEGPSDPMDTVRPQRMHSVGEKRALHGPTRSGKRKCTGSVADELKHNNFVQAWANLGFTTLKNSSAPKAASPPLLQGRSNGARAGETAWREKRSATLRATAVSLSANGRENGSTRQNRTDDTHSARATKELPHTPHTRDGNDQVSVSGEDTTDQLPSESATATKREAAHDKSSGNSRSAASTKFMSLNRGSRRGDQFSMWAASENVDMFRKAAQQGARRQTEPKSKTARKRRRTIVEEKVETVRDSSVGMRHHLSEEQEGVLRLALSGRSLFFTGSAGTGKSFTLRVIIEELKSMYGPDTVFVTASTGIAACNIGGTTVHSFAGIGIGKDDTEVLVSRIKKKPARHRWRSARVLVIDEISMISGELFTKLEEIGRLMRNNGRAFGGIQLVLCGDFFQLPPIPDRDSASQEVQYCFETEAWTRAIQHTIELHEVFRQAQDPEFANLLSRLRLGECNEADAAALRRRLGARLGEENGIIPTKLYPHRKDVTADNVRELDKLNGKEHVYNASDSGDSYAVSNILPNCQAPAQLTLKKNAQVILLKNLDIESKLANGSRGIVVGFKKHESSKRLFPEVRFACGHTRVIGLDKWTVEQGNRVIAQRVQVPLALAWAISIHKSQGMTIELVETKLGSVFAEGQAYVALSRATSMAGLSLMSFQPSNIRANEKVGKYYRRLSGDLPDSDSDGGEESQESAPKWLTKSAPQSSYWEQD